MSSYSATIEWVGEGDFASGRYSRAHTLAFDGGTVVPGSASPSNVPLPMSIEAAVDPEEMFVASLSACHMLWFLDLARRAGLIVEAYRDEASGVLAKNEDGVLAMTEVVLRPSVRLSGGGQQRLADLHHAAHQACFIANSVKTVVRVEAV